MKKQKKKNRGFTLVEVLICVGIIGIIAAISIPALLTSTSEKALEAQRKAFHSRMAQAFAQVKNLNDYVYTTDANTINYSSFAFVSDFGTIYKISAICKNGKFATCGIPEVVYDYYDESKDPKEINLYEMDSLSKLNPNIPIAKFGGIDTQSVAFRTVNGESVLLFMNPFCRTKKETAYNDLARSVCINLVYDINGKNKAPNTVGQDIGYITVFYPSDPSVVMPVINNTKSYTGKFSQMLSTAENEHMLPPTLEELTSILVNQKLTQITNEEGANGLHWSASYAEDKASPEAWVAGITSGASTVSTSGSESYRYYLLKK